MKKSSNLVIKEKTIADIYDGISDLAIEGNSEHLTITNIAKRSGYSIGNIYHYFKNIDDVIEQFAVERTRKRCNLIIELIESASTTSTALEILKAINDANFDFFKTHAPRGAFQKLAKKALSKRNFINELDHISMLLAEPIEKMIKKNESNTFKKLTRQEIELAVLMIMTAVRKPFHFNHELAGTHTHRHQCLIILLALLAK